jgi:hypothetical protein
MKNLLLTIALVIVTNLTLSAQSIKLTPVEVNYWNGFVDFVDAKGLKGSPELDRRDTKLSQSLFDEYNKINKETYDYTTFVTSVQTYIAAIRVQAIIDIKAGHTKDGHKVILDGYTVGDTTYNFDTNFMVGLSKIDGWAGSKTTSWKFPSTTYVKKTVTTCNCLEGLNKIYNH